MREMTVIFRKCTKCGKEAHTEEELELFKKDNRQSCGRATICKECARENSKKWRRENKEVVKNRIQRNREALKEYLGGIYRCEHCGFEHPTSAPFDFHHINSADKEGEVGTLIDRSLEKLFKEVDKCIFLCKNCHAIEHERLRDEQKNSNS